MYCLYFYIHYRIPTPKTMSLRTIDYRVKGKVQGVFFRVFVRGTAQELGIVGWVRNEPVRPLLINTYEPALTCILEGWRRSWHGSGDGRGTDQVVRAARFFRLVALN